MRNKRTKILSIFIVVMMLLISTTFIAIAKNGNNGNGKGMGVKRHPDTIKDADGRMHKVWQEPVDGQYEIFYGSQDEEKEMGIGTDKNPAIRLSYTPTNSTWPKISIDSSSDIIYVIWNEEQSMDVLDSDGGTIITESLFYKAVDNLESKNIQAWTSPMNIAEGSGKIKDFTVQNSEYEVKGQKTYEGIMDTDDDGIPDSIEVLGTKGNVTMWKVRDTDGDGLDDKLEYVYQYSPIVNDLLQPWSQAFLYLVHSLSDDDSDGFTYSDEGVCDKPITARVANVLDTGYVTYTFYPKADHSAYLVADLQIKRYGLLQIPPPENASYSLLVNVESETLGSIEIAHYGEELEWDRFKISVGSFDVYEDEETTVTINVNVVQPDGSGYRTLAFSSVMIAAPFTDYHLFNYKEGRDYSDSYLAGVLTEHFDICTDPNRPDLFLEVDYFVGHEPSEEMYSEAINAFSDAGIILHYKIDQTNLALSTATSPDHDSDGCVILRNEDEQGDLLDSTRNSAYSDYIHIVFANTMKDDDLPGWTLYGGAKSADTADDLTHSGILIADKALKDITSAASTLLERRIKVVVHEVGHTLGCSHEKIDGSFNAIIDAPGPSDTFNGFNVMRQNALDNADANALLRGTGNTDRRFGATEDIGKPRFSIESIEQMDLTDKLSVDNGRNIGILDQYI